MPIFGTVSLSLHIGAHLFARVALWHTHSAQGYQHRTTITTKAVSLSSQLTLDWQTFQFVSTLCLAMAAWWLVTTLRSTSEAPVPKAIIFRSVQTAQMCLVISLNHTRTL